MKMREGGRGRGGGFILLEVVGALVLLAVVAALCGRMAWLGLGMEAAGRQGRDRLDALAEVWQAWRERGGEAAVAMRDANGSWQVWDFPDESWLPAGGAGADGPQHWRRRRGMAVSGAPWEVEVLDTKAGKWRGFIRLDEAVPMEGKVP